MALRPGIPAAIRCLVLAFVPVLVSPLLLVPARADQPVIDATAFRRSLGAYEDGAFALIVSKDPDERAATIRVLTVLVSSHYPAARDLLLDDSSPAVQAALAQAIGQMGDDSPKAVEFLERMLQSTDQQVADAAIDAENLYLRAPLRFKRLWTRQKANSLWAEGWQQTARMNAGLVVGVAEAKPWQDPAWSELSPTTKINLLLRAGTRDSVPMAVALASAQDAPKYVLPCIGEPVDLPYLRNLLDDPIPGIKRYALRTLKADKDAAFQEGLASLIQAYKPGDEEIQRPTLGALGLGEFLPDMDEKELLTLLSKDPGRWFWDITWTLKRRGHPLSYADLQDQTQHPPLFDATKVKPHLIRSARLLALMEENLYPKLPIELSASLPTPSLRSESLRTSELNQFTSSLKVAMAFRAGLPSSIVEACRAKLKNWRDTTGAQLQPPLYQQEKDTIQDLLDLLSSSAEREQAWRTFRTSKDPLNEQAALKILKYGISQRDQAIQQLLQMPQEALERLDASSAADTCGHLGVEPWLASLPAPTPALQNLKREFSKRTAEAGIHDGSAFARAFLESRGLSISSSDPMPTARACCNPAFPVRRQAEALLDEHFHLGGNLPDIRNQADCKAWLEAYEGTLRNWKEPSFPPPSLSELDRSWIVQLLLRRQKAHFDSLVDDLVNPKPSGVIVCGGPGGYGPASPAVWQPSDVFIRQGNLEYEPDIRGLLERPEPIVRHAAAFALWKMFREPAALEVFKKDAQSTDAKLRASSLNTLLKFRRKEEADVYPSLLTEKDPLLRQVGLAGVQAFSRRDTLPEVLSLVADSDGTTSTMAVDTLGLWQSREALPLLIRLVKEDGPRATNAALAMTHFRTREDLDHLLALAADTKIPEVARIRFLGVLSQITKRQGLQYCDIAMTFGRNQKLEPAIVKEWQSWWNAHRDETPEERFKSVLAEQVTIVLQSKDDARSSMARASLRSFIPAAYCLEGPRPTTPQCRDTVTAWWSACKDESTWSIFANPQAASWPFLDVLWDIDPKRAQKLLFARFYQASLMSYDPSLRNWSQDYPYTQLVLRAGVDFGDPTAARCGIKDIVLANWLSWAKREGWAD